MQKTATFALYKKPASVMNYEELLHRHDIRPTAVRLLILKGIP